MRNSRTIQSSQEALLKLLIGTTYKSVSGSTLTSSLYSDVININTTSLSLEILGQIDELDFDGFEDDFCELSISKSRPSSLQKAEKIGRVYSQKTGQTVVAVHIARESVQHAGELGGDWFYEVDVAVILELENGHVCISMTSQHDETLAVTFPKTIKEIESDFVTNRYEEDIHNTFVLTKSIRQVN